MSRPFGNVGKIFLDLTKKLFTHLLKSMLYCIMIYLLKQRAAAAGEG